MGKYYGTTQQGKVFATIRQYFEGVPLDCTFSSKELCSSLLEVYNRLFPDDNVKNTTGVYDGIRCLAGMNDSPIKRIDSGRYRLVRSFQDKDSIVFSKKYHRFANKGRKYKQQKGERNG